MSELSEPLPTPPPEAPPPPAPQPEPEIILRTQGLTRAFHDVKAVNGVDLELRRGEVYGFLGRNGAGKTTTLRMLMGILRPDTGDIELMGQRVRRVGAAQKRHLGYVS